MAMKARDVLFTGGVPIRPAAKVFEALAKHIGTLAPRYPDGDVAGWQSAATRTIAAHPALEPGLESTGSPGGRMQTFSYRLKKGLTAKDLVLGPYGYATTAAESYAEFKRLQDAGTVPAGTRFQVSLPGPGTIGQHLELPVDDLLEISQAALGREIDEMLKTIPAGDLTVQIDFAGGDAEPEEYRRRPWAFDTPKQALLDDLSLDQTVGSAAWIVERTPPDVEVGFHICSLWHHDTRGGQDNEVLVDTANLLSEKITRPIAYIHIPIIPEHDKNSDYWPFQNLKLHPETRLNLGLINLSDGIEGARRRIEFATKAGGLTDFGVAFYCGLGGRAAPGAPDPQQNPNPRLRKPNAETLGDVLDLHRKVAEL
jgi:hypothetical protein